MTRAVTPKAQAEAETSNAPDCVSWCKKSPWLSLSSINWSDVAASGTRKRASANTISAKPSGVESEYSRSNSSTPPRPDDLERIASIMPVAVVSMRSSASRASEALAKRAAAMPLSAGAKSVRKAANPDMVRALLIALCDKSFITQKFKRFNWVVSKLYSENH